MQTITILVIEMADEKQKEVQEKVLVYQILQNQLEEFTNQSAVLETRLGELEITENALNEIKNTKEESETMFHIGSGCYGHGKLLDKDRFMIEIGADIMADKTLQEASLIIESRKKDIENVHAKLQQEMEKIANSMNYLVAELQKLSKGREDKGGEERGGDEVTVD